MRERSKITVTNLEGAPRVPFKLDGRVLFSSEKMELVHLTLLPGEGMELHSQPIDVTFFVIAGSGILETEEQSIPGVSGTCFHVPAGIQRGWKNEGSAEFRVIVVKELK